MADLFGSGDTPLGEDDDGEAFLLRQQPICERECVRNWIDEREDRNEIQNFKF